MRATGLRFFGATALSISVGLFGGTLAAAANGARPAAEASAAPAQVPPDDLLDEDIPGEDALTTAEDQLPEIAERNELTVPQLIDRLDDDSVWVDSTGQLYYVEPRPDPDSIELIEPAAGPFPAAQTFLLHSRAGSSKTIYLDFNGHTVSGTNWPADDAGPYQALPFDSDGVAGFGTAELDAIQSIWQRVSEDYAPFDVDVTTQDPGFDRINRSTATDQEFGTRVLFTDSQAQAFTSLSTTGVAYGGTFDEIGPAHAAFQPALVFPEGVSNSTKMMAEVATHEAGHNLGLEHDGRLIPAEPYYAGHSLWAPVMGNGYSLPVVQWSKGEYPNASELQDDLAVIGQNGLTVRPDDHTNNTGTATALSSTGHGVITPAATPDADLFKYVAPATGRVTFTANPSPVSPNLDINLRLYSAAVIQLAQNNPIAAIVNQDVASGLGASIQHDVVSGTTYYLQVGPTGVGTAATGYTTYGSLGQYTVTASEPPGVCPPDDGLEPNDLRSQGSPLTSGQAVSAKVCPGNDDYFTFGASAGAAIAVDALFSHAAGDLDIEVFNPDGTVLQSATSGDDNESIDVVAVQDGPHAVRVYGFQGASNSYQLTVTTACVDDGLEPNDLRSQGSPLTSGQAVSAKVCSGNDDYFSFAAMAGAQIRVEALFTDAAGDVDMTLFNPDGSVNTTAVSADDDELIDVVAGTSGTYSVRVYGFQGAENDYQLTVTVVPRITGRTPAAGATGVGTGTNVTATFSEAVQGVSNTTFVVRAGANVTTGPTLPATVTQVQGTNRFILNPTSNMAVNTTYTVTVVGGAGEIRNLAGAPLVTTSWTFTTLNTNTPPTVTVRTPAAGATGVGTGANMAVTFSEAVNGVSNTTFVVRTGDNVTTGPTLPATVTQVLGTNRYLLNPTSNLAPSTTYTVLVVGGAGAIRDLAGAPLTTSSWTFTTLNTPPKVTARTPAAGATGVSRTNNLAVTFSEAVNGVSNTTFVVRTGANVTTGPTLPATVTQVEGTNRYLMNPTSNLAASTTYTVTVVGGAAEIRDLAGAPLVTTSWTFTTTA